MADKFSTEPNNFAELEKDISPTKYLDLAGLITFFEKLKDYIEESDKKLNGTNLKLYSGNYNVTTNPTITEQIEDLWAALGEGGDLEGGIAANVSAILGQYVKDLQASTSQTTPLKIKVVEGDATTDQKDIFTISLEDNGLENTLDDLSNNRVKSITTANSGGSVTISVSPNKGDVTLSIDSSALTTAVENLQSGKIATVSEGASTETYVNLDVNTSDNAVTISINDGTLATEIEKIWDELLPKADLPEHLPTEHVIKLTSADGVTYSFDGTQEVDLTAGVNYAANAGKLGGQIPSYYATSSDLSNLSGRVDDIEGDFTKTVSVGTNGNYTKLSITPNNGDVKVSVDDTEVANIDERLETVESSYVKSFGAKTGAVTVKSGSTTPWDVNFAMNNNELTGSVVAPTHLGIEDIDVNSSLEGVVTISENVSNGKSTISIGGTLNGDLDDMRTDIANRVQDVDAVNSNTGTQYVTISVTDDTNTTTAGKQTKITIDDTGVADAIADIRSTIAGLGKVVEIKGVVNELPSTTTGYGDGDVLIVGDKEYICFESKWYLFGYTSELAEKFNTHKHTYTPTGSVESEFTGTPATITTGSTTTLTEVSKLQTAGSVPTYSEVTVSDKDHTHTASYTPAGTIEADFTGTTTTITTGGAGTGVVEVSKLQTAGSVPTYSEVTVSDKDHTHTASYTPAGDIESDFTGTPATITTGGVNNGGLVSVSQLKTAGSVPTYGEVTVSDKDHTHTGSVTPTGSVNVTFTGTPATITVGSPSKVTEVLGSVKTAGTKPTYSAISVSHKDHTHTVTHTPAGTIEADFTGTKATVTSKATTSAGLVTVLGSVKTAGTKPTYSAISVSHKDHTHTVAHTPAGTISASFTGTLATIKSAAPNEECVEVKSMKTAGTKPTYSAISVSHKDHTHTVTHTPAGTISASFTGTAATISIPATGTTGVTVATSPTITYSGGVLSITHNTTTVASNAHTHSASYTPAGSISSTFEGTAATLTTNASTSTQSVNSITDAGAMPTFETLFVAPDEHTHNVTHTPAGTISASFTGTAATLTTNASTSTQSVNSITDAGAMPTFNEVFVGGSDHKHDVEYTPAGTISASFTGTAATLTTNASTSTQSVNSITDAGAMPTFNTVEVGSSDHTHSASYTPAGTVLATFVGDSNSVTIVKSSATETVNSITDAGAMPTFNTVEVGSSDHTHSASYTPAGTVDSTFDGTPATISVNKSSATETVNSITNAGAMPTFESIEVVNSEHTHSASYKPTGSIIATFDGTAATISVNKSSATETVNSITNAGAMPTFESVEVPTSGHVHSASYTPAGTIESTFIGTQGTTNTPTQQAEVPDEVKP